MTTMTFVNKCSGYCDIIRHEDTPNTLCPNCARETTVIQVLDH